MASKGKPGLFAQFVGLLRKNLLIMAARRPFGMFILFYVIPIGILALLLLIPRVFWVSYEVGYGEPKPLPLLSDVLDKTLVIVRPPELADDVDRAIKNFTSSLKQDLIKIIHNEDDISKTCIADVRGVSNCFASVTFVNSTESSKGAANGSWTYNIRVDPSKQESSGIESHSTTAEKITLPLNMAINNAITGRNDRPKVAGYTQSDQYNSEDGRENLQLTLGLIGGLYLFAIIFAYASIMYRHTSLVTTERDIGMAQLIDSMGGRWAPIMRVLSWLVAIDIITIPCFILMGVMFQTTVFPSTNVGVLIGWQILVGLALNSSVAFASAFFAKARVSSIYVIGAALLLSVAAQVFSFGINPKPAPGGAWALAFLFPSSNLIFFGQYMVIWEYKATSAVLSQLPPADLGFHVLDSGMTQAAMLGFLALQIFWYPVLAVLVEYFMHGISFRNRSFDGASADEQGHPIVETHNLEKTFEKSWYQCCTKRKTVKAVDGVSFKGFKGQILCLAGPNGSGKTTTLHMIAGFINSSAGSVSLAALPSQIGICPQRNTQWEQLTVKEHIELWSKLKGGSESAQDVLDLIKSCDLEKKLNSQARTLSGGQKRKLQLACMFVGDSSVCLIDECTSGLDPLSRRAIWEILLTQRARRSIVFTTHFLDEVDILADDIVILSNGSVKCHGPVPELKNRFGNGYQVLVPNSVQPPKVDVEPVVHQDRLVYSVDTSAKAASIASKFSSAGIKAVSISGPQVEDVFLNVAEDAQLELEPTTDMSNPEVAEFKLSPSRLTSFWTQVGALYRKRWLVLRQSWWPYVFILALPLIVVGCINSLLFAVKALPNCDPLKPELYSIYPQKYYAYRDCKKYGGCNQVFINSFVNQSVFDLGDTNLTLFDFGKDRFSDFFNVTDSLDQADRYFNNATYNAEGILFFDSSSDDGTLIYPVNRRYTGGGYETQLISLYSSLKSKTNIMSSVGSFAKKENLGIGDAGFYAILVTLVQAIYPAGFVIYPALEKARMVRSIQYANGVRRAPLWAAYALFDMAFVLVISVITPVIMMVQNIPWIGQPLIMIPILLFYGTASLIISYAICHFVRGPLKAFMTALLVFVVMYVIAAVAFALGISNATSEITVDSVSQGIAFGLYLILPIGNVFRALLLGFNAAKTRCRNGAFMPESSFYAFGGPIFYLILQVALALLFLIWIEGDIALFRKKSAVVPTSDHEKSLGGNSGEDDVEIERLRVEGTDADQLRVLHMTKSFGDNVAVDDVTVGLRQGEVLALLGPNGAGKSTLVNVIQSDLSADKGQAFLCGSDSRTRVAQTHLGVCPQYDAMDLLTTRDQLMMYARIKGVEDPRANVDFVMAKLGLTPHAKKQSNKLSGGNKRKLNLAISILGVPPVLILDEPTSAMDAVAKRAFWKIIESIAPQHSILLTVSFHLHFTDTIQLTSLADTQHGRSQHASHPSCYHQQAPFGCRHDAASPREVQQRLLRQHHPQDRTVFN